MDILGGPVLGGPHSAPQQLIKTLEGEPEMAPGCSSSFAAGVAAAARAGEQGCCARHRELRAAGPPGHSSAVAVNPGLLTAASSGHGCPCVCVWVSSGPPGDVCHSPWWSPGMGVHTDGRLCWLGVCVCVCVRARVNTHDIKRGVVTRLKSRSLAGLFPWWAAMRWSVLWATRAGYRPTGIQRDPEGGVAGKLFCRGR